MGLRIPTAYLVVQLLCSASPVTLRCIYMTKAEKSALQDVWADLASTYGRLWKFSFKVYIGLYEACDFLTGDHRNKPGSVHTLGYQTK